MGKLNIILLLEISQLDLGLNPSNSNLFVLLFLVCELFELDFFDIEWSFLVECDLIDKLFVHDFFSSFIFLVQYLSSFLLASGGRALSGILCSCWWFIKIWGGNPSSTHSSLSASSGVILLFGSQFSHFKIKLMNKSSSHSRTSLNVFVFGYLLTPSELGVIIGVPSFSKNKWDLTPLANKALFGTFRTSIM